jgi:hypothetical protein
LYFALGKQDSHGIVPDLSGSGSGCQSFRSFCSIQLTPVFASRCNDSLEVEGRKLEWFYALDDKTVIVSLTLECRAFLRASHPLRAWSISLSLAVKTSGLAKSSQLSFNKNRS